MSTDRTPTSTEPFPVDWNEWRNEWRTWKDAAAIEPARRPAGYPKEPNMLADEVLGWFRCPDGTVELSEVTMPAFGERPHRTVRFIGYAFAPHLEGDTGVVSSFAELAEVLGL